MVAPSRYRVPGGNSPPVREAFTRCGLDSPIAASNSRDRVTCVQPIARTGIVAVLVAGNLLACAQTARQAEDRSALESSPVIAEPLREPSTLAAQITSQADEYLRAGPYDPKLETEQHWKRRAFRRLLAQFDCEPLEAPDWPGFDSQQLAGVLLSQSLLAHLEACGRTPVVSNFAEHRLAAKIEGMDCEMSANGGTYFFRKSDYPAWDGYMRLVAIDPAAQGSLAEPEPPRTFAYPDAFFACASAFGHDALALMP